MTTAALAHAPATGLAISEYCQRGREVCDRASLAPGYRSAFSSYDGLRAVPHRAACTSALRLSGDTRRRRTRRGRAARAAAGADEPIWKKFAPQIGRFGTMGGRSDDGDEDDDEPEATAGKLNPFQLGTNWMKQGTQKGGVGGGTMSSADRKGTSGGTMILRAAGGSLFGGRGRKTDPKTVFVAGGTGQTGIRLVKELLRAGFSVRAGVPDLEEAEQVAALASKYEVISKEEAKRLNVVKCDQSDADSVTSAIGNAGKVVVTIGPEENGPRGKVDVNDALSMVDAAASARAGHFVLISRSGKAGGGGGGGGAGGGGFFSFLSAFGSGGGGPSETKVIEKLVDSGLTYTVVRTGSTESVDDSYAQEANLIVETEGTLQTFSKVSKMQVAEVLATALGTAGLSENKVFEVSASPDAPAKSVAELLSVLPVDGRRKAIEEAREKAEEEEREREAKDQAEKEARAASLQAQAAVKAAAELEAEAKALAALEAKAAAVAAKASAKADAATSEVNGLSAKAREFGVQGIDFSAVKIGSGLNFFGKGLLGKATAPVEEEEEEEEEAPPAKKGLAFPSFPAPGKIDIGSWAPKWGKTAGDEEEEDEPEPAKPVRPAFRKAVASKRAPVAKTRPTPKAARPEPRPKPAAAPLKSAGTRNVLGGLFKQETVYMDED